MTCVCIPETLHGYRYNQAIGTAFAICAYTPRDIIGFILGMLNIAAWLFAQFPQLIKNYKNKSGESISPSFLIIWMVGDVTNLIGCLLTGQSNVQLYTAIYFLFMDILLLSSTFYYTYIYKKPQIEITSQEELENALENETVTVIVPESNNSKSGSNKRMYAFAFAAVVLTAKFSQHLPSNISSSDLSIASFSESILSTSATLYDASMPTIAELSKGASRSFSLGTLANTSGNPKECDFSPEVSEGVRIFGIVAAWICSVLYLTARFPQIYLNFKRKSCEGLSMFLFISSSLANVFYAISIVLPDTAVLHGSDFWSTTFAYILGSAATLGPSLFILFQAYIYRHNKPQNSKMEQYNVDDVNKSRSLVKHEYTDDLPTENIDEHIDEDLDNTPPGSPVPVAEGRLN